jgi:hypothetical protein
MSTPARGITPGLPTNSGSFKTTEHAAASGVTLTEAAPDRDWGTVSIASGSRTPWGQAQHVSYPADGIAFASCAGHGGFKLSSERNRAVPPALRNISGWYEEDAEANVVGFIHPEAFPHYLDGDHDAIRADAEQRLRHWFPASYEKATGETIPFGESPEKDRKTYLTENAGGWVLSGSHHETPEGIRYREISQVMTDGSFANPRWVAMSLDDEKIAQAARPAKFGAAQGYQLPAILPDGKHRPTVADPRERKQAFHGIADSSGLSASAQSRISKDLDKRWRSADGSVRSLREMIETDGVTGKRVFVENGVRKYHLLKEDPNEPGSNYAFQVSKETFGVIDAPGPTVKDQARTELNVAEQKFDKIDADLRSTWGGWGSAADKKREDHRKAGEALRVAREAYNAIG